ncbi:MAG: helix-turn-helix domain-containing protein [Actinomycetota bacterium]
MTVDDEFLDAVKPLIAAVGAELVPPDDTTGSDLLLCWEGRQVAGVRLPALHGALDRLIESVERELGASLADLGREDKQEAVRLLDDRGAFMLRRAVEHVADALGVSRFTVYNYLNADRGEDL